ncbi:Zinc finger PMZ-type protein [Dioscorea alata]|uniref:Zinc finger PMZ-type protein n=1 Tax=Dioscorea alata TaxID=55571 RepID=A0ACB7VAJ0_DIOAL|nr:Zinc finger PMZ-type protein [Dioscorea alata]
MTSNLAECVNSVLKGTRNLPITALVKSTYFRLAELFVRKGVHAQAQIASGQIFSEVLMKTIQENQQTACSIYVRQFDRDENSFMVDEMAPPQYGGIAGSYRIDLRRRWCDCGEFQTLHFPCRHVLAAYVYIHLHWQAYVDNVYRLETIFNVYHKEFQPMSNERYWNPYNGPRLCPDLTIH